jgi:integrase
MGKRKPVYKPYAVGKYRLGWYLDQFCVVWHEAGKRHRHRLGVTQEGTARTELADFARSHGAIAAAEAGRSVHTVASLYPAYRADRALENRQVHRMDWTWNVIGPTFGHLRPEDVSKALCRQHADARRALGRAEHSVHGELRLLRTILNWSLKAKLVAAIGEVWLPPFPEPRDRHLTREEIGKLLDAAEMPHIRLFVTLAIATAGRREALLQLTWDRVDFERGLIHLHDPARARTSKGRALVPMNNTIRAALAEAKLGGVSDFVIEWDGGPVKSIRRALNTALRRAGLKTAGDGAHLLRHSAAVLMAEAGVPMSQISQYLGHTSTATTEKVYARFSPDFLRGAAAALDLDRSSSSKRAQVH